MKIETGHGPISLITLISIWSISLVVNLPGLAITPILSDIKSVFPHASQLEVQMLTVLPNLFIIPFVLLSGKLSVSRNKIGILVTALIIYLASGLLYFWASSMTQLIVISCLLGIGCGLVIPIAAGLIADYFTGKYRMKQLGIKSGIANLALVVATFAVGWLAKENWRMPFVVYMLPIIPLLLTPFLSKKRRPVAPAEPYVPDPDRTDRTYRESLRRAEASASPISVIAGSPAVQAQPEPPLGKINWRQLAGAMMLYGISTYAVNVVAYYLPFIAAGQHISDQTVGVMTAVFFLAIMAPGFLLPYIVKGLKGVTIPLALLLILAGLLAGVYGAGDFILGVSAFAMGLGYGIIQPIVYDKAVECSTGRQSTLALSLVLAMNYTAVALAPFVVDMFRYIFGSHESIFPYQLNAVIIGVFFLLSLVFVRRFAFNVNKHYV